MSIPTVSVRTRLTLWYTAAFTLLLLAFAVAVYAQVRAHLQQEMQQLLDKNLAGIAQTLQLHADEIDEHVLAELFSVRSADGPVFSTAAWEFAQIDATPAPAALELRRYDAVPYYVKGAQVAARNATYEVVTAEPAGALLATLRELRATLLAGVAAFIGLALAGGYFLATRALKPARKLAEAAELIGAEQLGARLPGAEVDDEFGRVAGAFNRTLARLEAAFAQLRQFSADASHELRTPLTAIRSVGEAALAQPLDIAAYRETIGSMLEEVERLTRLVEQLLFLARGDHARLALQRGPLDLAPVVRDAVELLRPLAEEKGQPLRLELASLTVEGDPTTLRQAFVNVLHNAIRHGPVGSPVTVRLYADQGDAVVDIGDRGPGIPPEHRARVFERFYRVAADRGRDSGGTGLGLAIARWALHANGGDIQVVSTAATGACLRMRLPRL